MGEVWLRNLIPYSLCPEVQNLQFKVTAFNGIRELRTRVL